MARKLFFDRNNVPDISPAFSAGWENTTFALRRNLLRGRFPAQTAFTHEAGAPTAATNTDFLMFQFVSIPLAPQTISGTIWAWFRVFEASSLNDLRAQMQVYVVSNNGSVVRGYLINHDTTALSNEWPFGLGLPRAFPKGATAGVPVASAVNAQDGDRIVVEVGFRKHSANNQGVSGYMIVQGSGLELPANELSGEAGYPWIEFSHDIVFQDEVNTDPTITVNPTMDYGVRTRLGPSNTPGQITFTGTDAEQSGANELTFWLHTGANGTGTQVATGTFTSGVSRSVSIAHNAAGLNEGSNVLYLRVSDGTAFAPTNPTVTVLVDRTQPVAFTPSPSPSVVGASKQYTVTNILAQDAHSTATNELTWEVRTGSGGSGTLLASGSRTTSGSTFSTGTITDSGLSAGSNTRYVRIVDGAGNVRQQSFSVTYNTPPAITVNPSVTSYASATRLGPNNSPAVVSFTPADAEQTGVNALTFEIRTAAGSGGTLVASGTCTNNVSKNVDIAYNAPGLSGAGSQTLYLRVHDGIEFAAANPSFTILQDNVSPTVGSITHDPNPVPES